MRRGSLLVIFSAYVSLAVAVIACGEPATDVGNTGGSPATGGVSGAATGGSGLGGTPPGAGNGAGGAVAGTGNTAGVGPTGGTSGAGTGGVSGGTGGFGNVGNVGGDGTSGAGGAPPTGGTGGSSGTTGGTAGTGTTGGTGGGGRGGSSGGGSGGSVSCTITATSTRSTAIPTVGIVTFTTTLTGITSARIDFGPSGATPTMQAPVDLMAANYRTLLLGMKGAREYLFRVVLTSPAGTCTSQDYTFTTGAVPSSVPRITRTAMNAAAQDRGFIITSAGVSGGGQPAYIIDADGDVVWWASAPNSASRARMSYDGKDMYMMALNVQNSGGEMRKVSMDGMTTMNNISGLASGHHDFTVLPDNGIAVILWSGSCTSIVERSASGTISTVLANVNTVYQTSADCHTNAINYYASDNTYTLSDRNVNAFVKIRRTGQLVWQFGGSNPRGQAFTGSQSWQVNHGHHGLADGTFLFFNNGTMQGGNSTALSFMLNTTSWTATKQSFEYRASGVNSSVLGDVQRLPNGNTLVTYSTAGQIHEVSPTGTLVQRLQSSANSFGYAEFRKSLYGPPLR